MRNYLRGLATAAVAACLAGAAMPTADAASFTLNFDDQGLTGDNLFPLPADSPLEVVLAPGMTVTFTGGGVLTATVGLPTNTSSVYGSAQFVDEGYTNPLVVSFSVPVLELSFELFNGGTPDGAFEAVFGADADQVTLPGAIDTHVFSFAGPASSLTVALGNPGEAFAFFLDNFSFRTADEASVPEPAPLPLLGFGLFALTAWRRYRDNL